MYSPCQSTRTLVASLLVLAAAGSAFAAGQPPLGSSEARRLRQPAQAGPKETLIVRGSTTWEPIDLLTPTRFAAVEPKITLDIESPPIGSAGGITALIEGECLVRGVGLTDGNGDGRLDCDTDNNGVVRIPDSTLGGPGVQPDLAESSRAARSLEIQAAALSGLNLVGVQAGRDGLAVIVNAANPVPQLSQAQVQNMYLNPAAADWGLYGGTCPDPTRKMKLYTRNTFGGTYGSWIDLYILPANEAAFRAGVAAGRIVEVPTALAGVAAVASDPCGVFYAGIGDFATTPAVRAVATYKTIPPGIVPTQATVQAGTFPFSRPMFLYTIDVPSQQSAAGKFIDWRMSRAGQCVMYEAGFVPA